eukprot:TRINITY_DN67456_c0_g1_i2.p1 TRINITY_DN67456_c0_g1~~TRINITY_DN67456_c0_g1_i2.p1  ORF type:complete len:148 (+),score=52.68 TRINITY_DN67456_c0_g1_i2:178-621(+)
MCIRDRYQRRVHGRSTTKKTNSKKHHSKSKEKKQDNIVDYNNESEKPNLSKIIEKMNANIDDSLAKQADQSEHMLQPNEIILEAQEELMLEPPLKSVSYTHLRAHETSLHLVCRLLLEKKKKKHKSDYYTSDQEDVKNYILKQQLRK